MDNSGSLRYSRRVNQRRDLWLFDDAPILGGAELFALRLARWADSDPAAGRHVRLICPADSELGRAARRDGVDVQAARFPKPPAVTSVGALIAIRRILSSAPDSAVAVGNTALAQAYLAAASLTLRRHPPVVHLLHERETALRRGARWVLPRIGALVAVGENHAGAYRTRLDGTAVDTINIFLEPQELRAAVARRNGVRAPGAPAVGVIGRLIPEKGILELLDELAAEPDAWSTVRIAAAPQDPVYAGRVAARASERELAGRIELLGYLDDVGELLSEVDVVVVPSVGSEGQVLVILEALAYGVPCVVRESVVSREYGGLPVSSYRDARSLASALASLPDGRADPGELARRFGPEQAVAGIERAALRSPNRAQPLPGP
jgi:glycosyltransferase involved in cell wall biosynthesis